MRIINTSQKSKVKSKKLKQDKHILLIFTTFLLLLLLPACGRKEADLAENYLRN
jgi:hypothetical protein